MIKIILLCAMGMSTSIFVEKMKKITKNNNLDIEISSASEFEIDNYIEDVDIVLLAPQVSFMEEEVRELCELNGKKMSVIPMGIYGMINEDEVLEYFLNLLK